MRNTKIIKLSIFTAAVLGIGFFAFSGEAQAAEYYVDFANGRDSDQGSIQQPLKYHPWMGEFTGNVSLKPGDTVYMKRGEVWATENPVNPSGFIEVKASGFEGNLITTTSYGAGNRPIIKISAATTPKSVIYAYNKGFLKFDSLDIRHSVNTYDINYDKSGINLYADSHHIYITSNEISNVSFGVVSWKDTYELHIGDEGATTTATPDNYSNYIHDVAYAAISVLGRGSNPPVTNAYVNFNYIKNVGLGVACGGGGNNGNAYGIGFSARNESRGWPVNVYARYNRVENIPTWEGVDTHGCINCYFENNYIKNCNNHAALFYDTRLSFPNVPKFLYFRNNTLVQPQTSKCNQQTSGQNIVFIHSSAWQDDGTSAVDVEISGNTLYYEDRPPNTQYDGMIKLAHAYGTTVIKDNTIYNSPFYNSPLYAFDSAIQLGWDYGKSSGATVYITKNKIFNSSMGINLRGDFAESPTTNVNIYNNLIYNTDAPIKVTKDNLAYNVNIYNNDLIENGNKEIINFDSYGLLANSSFSLKNNILSFSAQANQKYLLSTGLNLGALSINNNLYFGSSHATPFDIPGLMEKNWDNLRLASYETDGIGPNVDPKFIGSSDFHLQSDSSARDRGATLTTVTDDYDGISRPQGSTYDIGAYEYIPPANKKNIYVDNAAQNCADGAVNYNPDTRSCGSGIYKMYITIQKAADNVVSGQTVNVMGGTYYERVRIKKSGAAGNYITYQAYPGQEVIIDASGTDEWRQAILFSANEAGGNFSKVKGFILQNGTEGLHFSNKSDIIIENVESRYNVNMGIYGVESKNIEIRNSHAHHNKNGIYFNHKNENILIDNCHVEYNDSEGIALYANANGTTYPESNHIENKFVKVINSESNNNGRQGMWNQRGWNILFKNNELHHNGATGIQIETASRYVILDGNVAHDNCLTNAYEGGLWIDETRYYSVRNNIMFDNCFGIGITQSYGGSFHHNKSYNNKSQQNTNKNGSRFAFFSDGANASGTTPISPDGSYHNRLAHNTSYADADTASSQGGLVLISNHGKPQTDNKFMNNILMNVSGGYEIDAKNLVSAMSFDYNLYFNSVKTNKWKWNNLDYTNFSGWKNASGQDAHGVNSDPLFENAGALNLNLQSVSSAVNKGGFLTTAVGSGTNSKNLIVADPYWFTDGYGVDIGDTIQLAGQTVNTTITAINYDTSALTLSDPLTWTNGQGVAFAYVDSSPDIGAFEYGGIVNNPADVNNDGRVNIKDIQACVKGIINQNSIPSGQLQKCQAVAPPAEIVNIKDVQAIIQVIVNPSQ